MRLAHIPLLGLLALDSSPAPVASPRPVSAHAPAPAAATMFRGGPAHTGVYPAPARATFGGIAWRYVTRGEVISTPVVSAGVVYVGSGDGGLYALDLRSGALRWRFGAPAAVHSSPAVAHGLVYFGCRDRDNSFYAVNAATGTLAWKRPTGPDVALPWGHESGDYYLSSPVVAGGTVVFGSGDGCVYAVEARTGAVRWRHRTAGRVRSSPAIAGDRVIAGDTDGCVYALSLATGGQLWRHETEGHGLHSAEYGYDRRSIQSSPAVADGRVFVGARDGYLYAIDAVSGERAWRFNHQISWVITSPAVADSTVYAGSSDARFVQAVDARTGVERWRYDTGNIVWSSPCVAGPLVYAADRSAVLYALDRATGRLAWQHAAEGGYSSSPVVSDSLIVIGNLDGSVTALRTTAGAPLQRAVYWDDSLAVQSWYRGKDVREGLTAKGYALLDTTGLLGFMRDRIRDRAPSAIVFALDALPAGAAGARDPRGSLLRRYLDSGGRAVWLGVPPLLWPRPRGTFPPDFVRRIYRDAAGDLLDVDFEAANFDFWGVRTSATGLAWGLPPLWRASWSPAASSVTTVLGTDETGLAGGWIKTYGAAGGAFVRPCDGRSGDAPPTVVQMAAEHRPAGGLEPAPRTAAK